MMETALDQLGGHDAAGAGGPFAERVAAALRQPAGEAPGLSARLRHHGAVTHFKPNPVANLRLVELGAGEGALLEHPELETSCVLSSEEVAVFRRMDGQKPVLELLYDDMASTGSLAVERVAGLIGRLKRAGMLAGDYEISARLERQFERKSWAATLLALGRRLRFLPLLPEIGAGPIAALGVIARVLVPWFGALVLGVVALSGLVPAAHIFAGDRISRLIEVVPSVSVLFALAVGAWLTYLFRQLVQSALLAAQGVPDACVDVGLAGGVPVLKPSRATRRRTGRARRTIATRGALLAEAALAAAAAWAADAMLSVPGTNTVAGSLLGFAPPPSPGALAPLALAGAAAAWTFADLCPMADLLGSRLAASASGFDDLAERGRSWLVKRLPRRLTGRAPDPATSGWMPAPEGHAVLDEPAPARTSGAEERWYLLWNVLAGLWIAGLVASSLLLLTRVLVPLYNAARATGATGPLAIAGAVLLALAAPLALSGAGTAIRLTGRTIGGFLALVQSLELSLYVPSALVAAVGLPLAAVFLERESDRLLSVLLNMISAVGCPILALWVRRDHRGSRLAPAFFWLTVYYFAAAFAIPLWLERFHVIAPMGDVRRFFIAINALSFFCLFPFFLFTFLNTRGRWVAVAALLAPFLAALVYFRFQRGIFLSDPGINFLAVAGPASFAVLAFFTMFGFLDTPLTAFWAFLAASLALEAFSRLPAFTLTMEPAGREELAFTYGVRGIAGLLALAALGAHRVAFRRLRLGAVSGAGSRVARESVVLVEGFVRLANALLALVAGHLGSSRSSLIATVLETRLKHLDVPLAIHEERLVALEVDDTPLGDLSRRLRKIAGELLRGIAYLAGEDFLKRGLRLTQGCLYWVERELLSYWVFEGIDWGTACRPVTFALSDVSRTELLARIPLFAALPPEDLSDLAFRLRRTDAGTGEVVIKQGDAGHEFYVIVEGKVEVLQDDSAGVPRRLAVLGALDCFGELALLEGVPRSATVRALQPTVLLTLSETDFRRLVANTPEAADRVVPLIRFGGFLSRVPLFADLPTAQLLALALRLREEPIEPGAAIVREGESGDRFYLVREGTLEVSNEGRPLGRLGPGEYFGEIALLTQRPRTATVTAVTPAVLLSLGQEDFYSVLSGFLGTFRRLEEFANRRLYMMRSQAG